MCPIDFCFMQECLEVLGRLPRRRDDERYFDQGVPIDFNKLQGFSKYDFNTGIGYKEEKEPFPVREPGRSYPGGHMVGWNPRPGRPILDAATPVTGQTYDPINYDTHSKNLSVWIRAVACSSSAKTRWEPEVRMIDCFL